MRRSWVVIAGLVAVASLTVGSGVAAAQVETSRSTSTCSNLIKKYQKTSASAASIDATNPQSFQAAFKAAAKAARSAASTGPSALRGAFRHLATGYDRLAKLDFTNPASLSQFTTFATTFAADLARIGQYFAKQCNFTIPTTPTSSGIVP